MQIVSSGGWALVASFGLCTGLVAQGNSPLEIGADAPNFALPGATAEGHLPGPTSLEDFEGKTIVLAFFYKARTKG